MSYHENNTVYFDICFHLTHTVPDCIPLLHVCRCNERKKVGIDKWGMEGERYIIYKLEAQQKTKTYIFLFSLVVLFLQEIRYR